jgi:hypothetical protein
MCYGKTVIYGRLLNNNPVVTTKSNLSLTYNFQGGVNNVLSLIGVQVGNDRYTHDIYIKTSGGSRSVLNVNTVTNGSSFAVNPTLTTSVTGPSTTAGYTVSVGVCVTSIAGRNVGIGITNPSVALDVVGSTKLGPNSKSISCIQFGTGSGSGTITFTSSFPTTPIVVATTISSSSTLVFSVTVYSVSTTAFSYYTKYIGSNGAAGGLASESFNWIAISN